MSSNVAPIRNKEQSPIDRQIQLKEKLIKRLRKEIEAVKDDAAGKIANIEFRIKMAATLRDALQKGK